LGSFVFAPPKMSGFLPLVIRVLALLWCASKSKKFSIDGMGFWSPEILRKGAYYLNTGDANC